MKTILILIFLIQSSFLLEIDQNQLYSLVQEEIETIEPIKENSILKDNLELNKFRLKRVNLSKIKITCLK